MKYSILFCILLIVFCWIEFSAGGRSSGGGRSGSSRGSGGRSSSGRSSSGRSSSGRSSSGRSPPASRPISQPVYRPPVHAPAPPVHVPWTPVSRPSSNSAPKPSAPKPSSDIFIHNEGGGRLKPPTPNNNKPTYPSAPIETINKVHQTNQQHASLTSHGSQSNPSWANPSYKPPPNPSNPVSHPPYPVNTPIGSGNLYPKLPAPYPNSHPAGMPQPGQSNSHIGFQSGASNGGNHQPIGAPHQAPSLGNSHIQHYPTAANPPSMSGSMGHPYPQQNGGYAPIGHSGGYGAPIGHPGGYGAPIGHPGGYGAPIGHPGGYAPPVHNPYQTNSYPQQPGMSTYTHPPVYGGPPVSQPFVPGQTIILPSQSSNKGPGLGQMVKEALVFSTINAGVNAGVNRLIYGSPHQSHSYDSAPRYQSQPYVIPSESRVVNNTTIIYNNYGDPSGTIPSVGEVPQYPPVGGIPQNPPVGGVPQNPSAGGVSQIPTTNGGAPFLTPIFGGVSQVPPATEEIKGVIPIGGDVPSESGGRVGNIPSGPVVPTSLGGSGNYGTSSGFPSRGAFVDNLNTTEQNRYIATSSSAGGLNSTNTTGTMPNPVETIPPEPQYYISESELANLTETLFAKDTFDMKKHIMLNLQKQTNSSNVTDEADRSLFIVDNEIFRIPTIEALTMMFDNYELNSTIRESPTPEMRNEEQALLSTIMNTDVMKTAMRWLAEKYYVNPDEYEMKDRLRHIWLSRSEGSTSGFERIFMAEIFPGPSLIGAQNWIYFNHRESLDEIDYMGYSEKLVLGDDKAKLVKINLKMKDVVKPNTTMLIGTTPELEMALYTICFFVRPNDICPISLGGTKFNIFTHSFQYFGEDSIDLGMIIF